MNNLIQFDKNHILIETVSSKSFPEERSSKACNGELEEEGRGLFSPVKSSRAGQRRLRMEAVYSLAAKASIDKFSDGSSEGLPPLLQATKAGDFETVKILVESGADLDEIYNFPGTNTKDCALHSALRHPQILKFLIDSGANIEIKLSARYTPLHFAVQKAVRNEGNSEAIKILLDRGANVNTANIFGQTPLHYACQYAGNTGNKEIIIALLNKGANIQIADEYRAKPMHYIYLSCDLDLLKEFVKRGASLNEPIPSNTHQPGLAQHGGLNALHCAVRDLRYPRGANFDLLKWLIDEQKMNVNALGPSEFTPIAYAIAKQGESENFELLDFLVTRGANLNAKYYRGKTPLLTWAKQYGIHRYILDWLIEHGATQ